MGERNSPEENLKTVSQVGSKRGFQTGPKTVNVYGLGYVGSVTSICLASIGHEVLGVEIVKKKVEALNEGKLPLFEPGLEDLYQRVLTGRNKKFSESPEKSTGSFRAITEVGDSDADVSVICVGTPSLNLGGVDLTQIKETTAIVGRNLKNRKAEKPHLVIFRSTVPAGTTEGVLIPVLESESGKKVGEDFNVCFYPEFLREGHAVSDFFGPSLNIVGCTDENIVSQVEEVFVVDKKAVRAQIKSAEMIKYANNSFHALKVTFANEIGTLCKAYNVDSEELTRLFLSDVSLNLSPYYLRPGFAFGGSCLPKELRSVSALAHQKNVRLPLLEAVLPSNNEHVQRLVAMISTLAPESVGFAGVTFKPNTDDIRESPLIDVIERILQGPSYKKPLKVFIFDRDIVQEKVRSIFGERVLFCDSYDRLFERVGLLILGPQKLDELALQDLQRFKGSVIDLKWHALPTEIKAKPNYYSLC